MAKEFSVTVLIRETGEIFTVNEVSNQTKIVQLKIDLEIIAGIPTVLQRLMYLDQGDMEDESTFRHHDIVPGAQIKMEMWGCWTPLVVACVKGTLGEVMSLGVTEDSKYRDPNSSFMNEEMRKKWFHTRASVALYIAAHRGRVDIMKKLLLSGADIAATTKYDRIPLHVAASQGQDNCVDLLLSSGAGSLIHFKDKFGKTPLQLAAVWNHKSSERRLFLFQWQVRADQAKGKISRLKPSDLMAHQMFDSSLTTWMRGNYSQMYFSNILPPQEFEGTGLGAKPSKHRLKAKSDGMLNA